MSPQSFSELYNGSQARIGNKVGRLYVQFQKSNYYGYSTRVVLEVVTKKFFRTKTETIVITGTLVEANEKGFKLQRLSYPSRLINKIDVELVS